MGKPCPTMALNNVTVASEASGRPLLDSLTLEISQGSILGIASANVRETTACLEVLAERVRPTIGTVLYDGARKTKQFPTVSVTWEDKGFFPEWSLFDNVFLGVPQPWCKELRHHHEMYQRAEYLYEELDTPLVWHQSCHTMSPHERVIALIVRALLRPASLYLFDRTLDALDEKTLLRILQKLQVLTQQAVTVVISTGKLQEIRSVCTRTLLLSCGRKVFYGDPSALSLLDIECRLVNSTSNARKVIGRELHRERHEANQPDVFITNVFRLITRFMGKDVPMFCLYRDLQQNEHFYHTSQIAPQDVERLQTTVQPFLRGESDGCHTCRWGELEYKISLLYAPEFFAQRGAASKIIAVFGCILPELPFEFPLNALLRDFETSVCSLLLERDLESEIKHRERLDSLGMMASGVAHDFNNSLFAIQGATTVLQKKMIDPTLTQFLDIILRATGSAETLTRKLLSFSQKGTTTFQRVDLHAVITDALSLLHSGTSKKVEMRLELKAQESTILGDAAELKNMVVNIGLNAIHAVDAQAGTVLFATTNAIAEDGLQNDRGVQPSMLEMTITDNGPGVRSDVIERIFEPFVSTKLASGGNGLGLSVVYGTVKEHNGSIGVQNVVGGGARFSLRFPISQATPAVVPVATPPVISHGQARILICDDDDRIRFVLTSMLEELGYEVTSTSRGAECIDVFHAQQGLFDAVLLDDLMPGMSGYACFQQLRVLCPRVKVLIVSGYRRSDFGDDITRTGIYGFLRKPVRLEELSEALTKALGQPHSLS